MRRWPQQRSSTMAAAITLLNLLPSFVTATSALPPEDRKSVLPIDDQAFSQLQNAALPLARRCQNPCGWKGQLCCNGPGLCYTDANNEAQCSSTAAPAATPLGSGYWQLYTSTYVETDLETITTVYSSFIPTTSTYVPAQATGGVTQCNTNAGQKPCGNICCDSDQYCLVEGQCANYGSSATLGPSASAPLRVTSSGIVIVTNTATPTTTVGFQSAVTTQTASVSISATSSGGLSGGAIAGIVIGVILGLILLFLICLCLCFRAAWDGILAIFGLGNKKRKRTETVEYEHYSRHGDSRRWYGDRPGRPNRPPPPPKKSGGIGWGGVAAGLGGLAIMLGLKRRYDRKQESRREKIETDYSSLDYSYDYTISEESSDRRTRDTRRPSRSRR